MQLGAALVAATLLALAAWAITDFDGLFYLDASRCCFLRGTGHSAQARFDRAIS